ncbi:M20/M25/M40 family metallo-hydrolase [Gemmatimonas sp.]|uniref:M20/M25/M40 family metallo-hydrolase n=1 Tax=Gemmatimonas sp. TaxID=1962908 RepID=UPI00286C6F60|nr:M20/M25/M40 family metallo-hydrolase [Gemmatimonas sp.]
MIRSALRTLALPSLAAALLSSTIPACANAQAADSTALLLAQLIRANSSNPPGHTQQIADILGPLFRARGFQVDIIPTPDSAKVHFFARLKGNGSKKPLLLAAHADVVGVEREKWSVDPFAGVIKDGAVYGRGAIDFKGGIAVFARAAMLLADRNVPLDRDVIFLAEADEEGAPMNTTWLSRQHWDKMDAEFALNEGGWIIKRDDGRVQYVSISTSDKRVMSVTLTAKGTSTHASMPLPDNALVTVGRALAKLGSYETPIEFTPDSRKYFATLAKTSTGEMARLYTQLLNGTPEQVNAADRMLSRDPLIHSLMRNTIAPVIVAGGFRSNVIPGSAEVTLNVRLIPGSDPAALIGTLEKLFNDPLLTVKMTTALAASSPASPDTSLLYRVLAAESKSQWPEAEVTPYLFQAGTDAAAWRNRGIPVFGIYPYPISTDELRRMHGNDERVSVESLRQGTEMVFRTLKRVAGSSAAR